MSNTRWSAPQAGWYHVTPGRDPEFLGTDEPVIESSGPVTVVHFDSGDAALNGGGDTRGNGGS